MSTIDKDNENKVTQEQFDELKASISSMETIIKAKDDSIDALTENNKKLTGEKRDEIGKVEAERVAKLASEGKHDEILKEREEQWGVEKKDILGKVSTLSNQLNGMTGDGVLSATLDSIGVNPDMKAMVETHFRAGWTFDEHGSVRHNDKALADSIKEWATTASGKPFLLSNNSGSGAQTTTTINPTNKPVSEMTYDEKMKHFETEDK